MSENNQNTEKPSAAPAEGVKSEAAAEGAKPEAPRGGDRGGRNDRNGGGKGRGRGDRPQRQAPPKPTAPDGKELTEKVVFINRCSKVVKGGRRFSFSALLVTGDLEGRVGVGFGKAKEVAECINKAGVDARRQLKVINLNGPTIPHEVQAEFGGGKVLLKPAVPGTGIIAGGGMRAVCEAVGIKDVLGKSLGSNNHANVVKATVKALESLRTRDQIYAARGKKTQEAL